MLFFKFSKFSSFLSPMVVLYTCKYKQNIIATPYKKSKISKDFLEQNLQHAGNTWNTIIQKENTLRVDLDRKDQNYTHSLFPQVLPHS